MPELPEVETVMRGLTPAMAGNVIIRAAVNRPDLRWPFPDRMSARLEGQKVLGLRRRSKYILIDLQSGETLLVHLGMSGRMMVSGDPLGQFVHEHPKAAKHDHVVLDMANGARITFNDPRRFGAMDLLDTATAQSHPLLADIGPEPLGNEFNESYLKDRLKSRRSPIKTALLDQKLVAGLGNIYVCESLYRAKISPETLALNVAAKKMNALVPIIRDVLLQAIDAGGSSLKDFRQADGELGYFQHVFDVYGREGDACHGSNCTAQIARIVQAGRSTFYCPSCQR